MDIKIACPQCGKRYTLRTPNPAALSNKTFNCTKCGYGAPFPKLLGNYPAGGNMGMGGKLSGQSPLKTHIAGGQGVATGGRTQVSGTLPVGGVLLIVASTGKQLQIGPGTHTLGRQSSDSRSSVMVAPDQYMSRCHAKLEVNASGAVITSMVDNNPVVVNGHKLNFGQSLSLRSGDVIVMGETEMSVRM